VRFVYRSSLHRTSNLLTFQVTGSGFLKHMMRNMIGTLLEVGKGNLVADDVRARLQANNMFLPGPTAPATGLFLISVEYD
jgi:tRNA pseudouridine38-40 synthase